MVQQLSNDPLVSCLCVTWDKVAKLKRAVACFRAQTYPNRELIIIYEDNDPDTVAFLATFEEENIYCYPISANPKLPLGELRNISVEKCNGDYFCQWDDDDYYHQDRIKCQMEAVRSSYHPISLLTNWIIYDETKGQAYFSMFRLWEGTILCKKEEFLTKVAYPLVEKKEDSHIVNVLLEESRVFPTVAPNLYIYVYHGKNTWQYTHFQMLFALAQKLSPAISQTIGDILDQKYTVKQASELLNSKDFLVHLNYFARKTKREPALAQS